MFGQECAEINEIPYEMGGENVQGVAKFEKDKICERGRSGFDLDTVESLETCITEMNARSLNFWLTKFVQEVRKVDEERYPSRSLYSICCGLQRYLEDINGGDAIKLLSKDESR